MKRIIICGPPHSGKSVFLSNLQESLPGDSYMLIYGAPDGEWHWSNEADQSIVKTLRKKGKFTLDWCGNVLDSIKTAEQHLVLVDTGGVRAPDNEKIFAACDGYIILSSSPEETIAWREFGEQFGCKLLAELDSELIGTSLLYPDQEDGVIRGLVTGLERGQIVDSPVIAKVAEMLLDVIAENKTQTEAELLANINGFELANQIGITDLNDPYLGYRPMHLVDSKIALSDLATEPEIFAWNIRNSFMGCMVSSMFCQKPVNLFGVSEGYVKLPDVQIRQDGGGEGLQWEIIDLPEHTLVKYQKTGFYKVEMLQSLIVPEVDLSKGVVIYTDGPPIWLDATIAKVYASAKVAWIATACPIESARPQPSLDNQLWNKVYPDTCPFTVVYGDELGTMVPIDLSLLIWSGGGRQWRLGSGEKVTDRSDSHMLSHAPVLPFLSVALKQVRGTESEFRKTEVDLGKTIGLSICVETNQQSEIVFAQRPGRSGLTRFTKNQRAEQTSKVSLILRKVKDYYEIVTAFIGPQTPAEPWDSYWADDYSKEFWDTHALIWGSETIIPETEINLCPW